MGWAIKRSDGTYRGWNQNAQDDVLQIGEVWEELAQIPIIAVPPDPRPSFSQIRAAMTQAGTVVELKVALLQLLSRLGG